MKNITTILLDMYGVILEESKGYFIPYTFGSFDQAKLSKLLKLSEGQAVTLVQSIGPKP